MADLSTLNPNQKEVFNTYIANDIPEEDAFGLVTGTVTQDDYFKKLDSQVKPKDQDEALSLEGYDVDLMKSTAEILKNRAATSEGIQDVSPEDTFERAGFSKEEAFNFSGIRTDVDKEAPGSIRTALSFALPNESLQLVEGKNLLKKYLVNEKGIKPDLVEKFKDKIEFRYQPVGEGTDQESNALVYKIPKELGGDGMFYAYNSPKNRPTIGDVKAIAGDAIPVVGAITAGTFGSAGGIPGAAVGSALGTFAGELTRLYIGKNVYGLHADMDEKEFDKIARETAAIYAGVDLIATPTLLGLGQIIKNAAFTGAKDKISGDTIKKFIASGGKIAPEITTALDDAKKVLLKAGVPEKEADDYLAISVANAIPESGIIPKGSKGDIVYSKILNDANKKAQAAQVEKKVIKTLTGLDNVPEKEADEIIDAAGNRVKQLRQDELIATDANVADAFGNLQKTKQSFYKDPVTSDIDSIAVTFNDVNQTLGANLSNLETKIIKAAKNNNIQINLDDKEALKVFNKIIKEYSTKVTKKLPKIDLKKATQAEREAYNSIKSVNDLADLLQVEGKTDLIKKQLNIIKKGLTNLETLTFDEAVTWRAFIRQAEQSVNLPKPTLNALTKLKGVFNKAIDDATANHPETAKLVQKYDDTLFNYRNTALEKLSNTFGAGASSRVTKNVKLIGENRNVFNSFVEDTPQGLVNAEKLGNLINLKQFNSNQINKVTNALYENYYNKVFPKAAGEAAEKRMTHKEFIDKYGDNYRLILGDKKYNEFAKSNQAALNQFQKSVNKQIQVQNKISEYLPGINIKTLDTGNPTAIVDEIFRVGKNSDISGLIKSINKLDPQLTTDIRKIYLRKFIKEVSVDVETRTLTGGTGERVTGLNGQSLSNFLENNKEVVKQLFGDNFYSAHKDLARALKIIQEPLAVGKTGAPGLTEAANKAGLFIDIFAGPLNHKRLILNRIGRIYDGFDLGGDSLALLRDYNKFVEAAKRNYLGGNYPLILDALGKSKKPADKTLLKRFIKSVGIEPRARYSINPLTNPLATKEYIKEKLYNTFGSDRNLEDQPDVFTPVDTIFEGLGEGGKLAYNKALKPVVKKLYDMFKSTKKFEERDFLKEEFEKKLAK
jgi:hypothetical protein